MSLEEMMMACRIDTKEGRHIEVTDSPGEFLYAEMKDTVLMLLKGTIA